MSDRTSLNSQLIHARETGDAAAEAQCLMQWAIIADEDLTEEEFDEHTLSAGLYAQATKAFEQAGDIKGQAEALTALADNLALLDDAGMEQMAHHLYEDVFSLYARLNDSQAQARILIKTPPVMWRLGEQKREVFYDHALSFMDQFSDPVEKANFLVALAETMVGWPRYKDDAAVFEKVLRLYETAHAYSQQAAVIRRLGQITDDDDLALSYRLQAAEMYERIGDFSEAGSVWNEIGANTLSSPMDQIPPHLRAVEFFRQAGSTFQEAMVLNTLGRVATDADAQVYLERALALFQTHEGAEAYQVSVLKQLALLNKAHNDIACFRAYYEQALALIPRTQNRAHFLWEWGQIEHHRGHRDQAFQRFQQALDEHQYIYAEFTPSMITGWKNELVRMGYLPAAEFEDNNDDEDTLHS